MKRFSPMIIHFGTITLHLGHHGSLHGPPASARRNRLDTAAAMFSIQIHLKSWALRPSHLNLKKRLRTLGFCHFVHWNVLRATRRCNFSWIFFSWYLRIHRFSELTFRASKTTKHWKNTAFCAFAPFPLTHTRISLDLLVFFVFCLTTLTTVPLHWSLRLYT